MLKSIKEIQVKGKSVLMRVDYNIPIQEGVIQDDTRIRRSLPTIRYLLDHEANLVLCSHLGRPKGKVDPQLSLKPAAERLEELIDNTIKFVDQIYGPKVDAALEKLGKDYRIMMIENTRFDPGEEKNSPELAKQLSKLGDIFVSDAFGAVHRAHASTEGVTHYLPGYAGLLVMEEYERITDAMHNPQSPALAIFGGAKISTKLDVLNNFLDKTDVIALGGGMANTFLKASGKEVGKSLVEEDLLGTATDIMNKAKEAGVTIILPQDVRIAKSFDEPIIEYNVAKVVSVDQIPSDAMILDIGPKTALAILDEVMDAKTITWNGPLGVFEKELYREGTMVVAKEIIKHRAQTVIGGGETAYAINLASDDPIPQEIHVSTGGGASLELMGGAELPGLSCLTGEVIDQ